MWTLTVPPAAPPLLVLLLDLPLDLRHIVVVLPMRHLHDALCLQAEGEERHYSKRITGLLRGMYILA